MKNRIVLVVPVFPQISETFIVSKFMGLLNRGLDLHIVCNKSNKNTWLLFPELINGPQIKHRVHITYPHRPNWLAIPLFIPIFLLCLIKSPQLSWRYLQRGWGQFQWDILRHFYLDAHLIRLKPKIVHFEFGSLAIGRTYLKDLLDVKLSVSFRGHDINYIGLGKPDYYHDIWEKIDSAHFLGQDLWIRAQKRGAPTDFPHSLIPPALDLSRFTIKTLHQTIKVGTVDRRLRIISVGRLHWKKGYEYSLNAVKQLLNNNIHCDFRIVGDGDHKEALYFARNQMGLDDVVTFIGSLSHSQVIQQYQWADIFIHSAVSEGFCNAVLEAQAMRLPVICTNADGLRENIEDGITGFIIPCRDPAAMAEKLALLAENGSLRERMGQAGRQRVEQQFQLENQLDAFEAFYGDL